LPVVLSVVVLPAMIVALEYFLTIVPAGFPLYFGLTQQSNVFAIQSAVVFGPAIVSFLLFLSNSMLYQSLRLWFACRRRAVFLSGVLLVLLAVNLCFGVWHFKTRSLLKGEDKDFLKNSARLHLVQPNLDFKAGMYSAQVDFFYNLGLHRLIFLSREPGGSELLVWPELPLLRCMMQEEEPAFRQFIKTLRTPLLLGCPYADYHSGGVQNAAVVLSELGLVRDKYAKVNLFPKFEGENYLAGKEVRTVFVSDKMPRVGAMLCFEVLLPQVSRTLVRQGAQFLVCLSNDTWFEDTAWPRLHMAYMIFRAVENGCYALFMSNNGPSVLVSPAGQIITRLPYFEMANAEVTVGLVPSPTLYRRFGDWFAKLCLAFLFFIAGLQLSRRLYFGWAGAQHFGRRKG
jgi:apolipoprotein N-acyltransferase